MKQLGASVSPTPKPEGQYQFTPLLLLPFLLITKDGETNKTATMASDAFPPLNTDYFSSEKRQQVKNTTLGLLVKSTKSSKPNTMFQTEKVKLKESGAKSVF